MESLPENIEEYKKFKVVDLKQLLSNVGLSTTGKFSIASIYLLNVVRLTNVPASCFMFAPGHCKIA